jgi:hypothetical protein
MINISLSASDWYLTARWLGRRPQRTARRRYRTLDLHFEIRGWIRPVTVVAAGELVDEDVNVA